VTTFSSNGVDRRSLLRKCPRNTPVVLSSLYTNNYPHRVFLIPYWRCCFSLNRICRMQPSGLKPGWFCSITLYSFYFHQYIPMHRRPNIYIAIRIVANIVPLFERSLTYTTLSALAFRSRYDFPLCIPMIPINSGLEDATSYQNAFISFEVSASSSLWL
jgi:hypothetical protein